MLRRVHFRRVRRSIDLDPRSRTRTAAVFYFIVCMILAVCLAGPAKVFAQAGSDSAHPHTGSTKRGADEAMDEAYRRRGNNDLTGAKSAFLAALAAGADAQVVWFELGQLARDQRDASAAREAFERSLSGSDTDLKQAATRELAQLSPAEPAAAQPKNNAAQSAAALLDQAYRHKAARDYVHAEQSFLAAERAGASAQLIALELAYVSLERHDTAGAKRELQRAMQGPDAAKREQADKELAELADSPTATAAPRHFWGDLYTEAYGWDRVVGANHDADLVPTARLRGYYTPFADVDLHLFLFAQITRDVASRGPGQSGLPLIYADNSALLGPGLLFRFWSHRVGIFAQLGPALPLVNDGSGRGVQFDARIGAYIGLESEHCWPTSRNGSYWELALCHELYAEASYVSRYKNDVIGFARGRSSLGLSVTGPVEWQLTAEVRAGKDLNEDYYNNFVDAGIGPRWRLLTPVHIDLMFAPHLGSYFGPSHGEPPPNPRHYVDLRLQAASYIEF
jgi:hypothetical protein